MSPPSYDQLIISQPTTQAQPVAKAQPVANAQPVAQSQPVARPQQRGNCVDNWVDETCSTSLSDTPCPVCHIGKLVGIGVAMCIYCVVATLIELVLSVPCIYGFEYTVCYPLDYKSTYPDTHKNLFVDCYYNPKKC